MYIEGEQMYISLFHLVRIRVRMIQGAMYKVTRGIIWIGTML